MCAQQPDAGSPKRKRTRKTTEKAANDLDTKNDAAADAAPKHRKKRKATEETVLDEAKDLDGKPPAAAAPAEDEIAEKNDNAEEQEDGDAKRKRVRKRTRKRKGEAVTVDETGRSGGVKGELAGANAAAAAAASSASGGANPCDIYCEGISYDAGEADVEAFFAVAGRATSVRMPRYQDSGRPRGYAHITFADAEAATAALELDRKELLGRFLTVRRAQPRAQQAPRASAAAAGPRPAGCRTVFVKNLPYSDVSEDSVAELFRKCGKVTSVRLAMWNHTGKMKGFGYVEFRDEKAAEAAVKSQGLLSLGGRPLIIDYDPVGTPKGSFRTTDGRQWSKAGASSSSSSKPSGRGGKL